MPASSLILAGGVFIAPTAVSKLDAGAGRDLPAKLQGLPEDSPLRRLPMRQRGTLAPTIEGHFNKEIARKLGFFESTLKARRDDKTGSEEDDGRDGGGN